MTLWETGAVSGFAGCGRRPSRSGFNTARQLPLRVNEWQLFYIIAIIIFIGNQADVNAETALEYWENEDDVKQILLYMESIQNPANFRKLASRITKKKPILALKAGRSAAPPKHLFPNNRQQYPYKKNHIQ